MEPLGDPQVEQVDAIVEILIETVLSVTVDRASSEAASGIVHLVR